MHRVFFLLLLVLLPSCAAIFRGSETDVFLTSSPEGGVLHLDGEAIALPASVSLPRLPKPLRFEHPQQGSMELYLGRHADFGWIVWSLFWSPLIIGPVIDIGTGSLVTLDSTEFVIDFDQGKAIPVKRRHPSDRLPRTVQQ